MHISYKRVHCRNIVIYVTVYMVIFAIVLVSQISRVRPRESFHFNLCLFIVWKHQKNCKINPSRISAPSPKSWKYLYVKIMVYTVCRIEDLLYVTWRSGEITKCTRTLLLISTRIITGPFYITCLWRNCLASSLFTFLVWLAQRE